MCSTSSSSWVSGAFHPSTDRSDRPQPPPTHHTAHAYRAVLGALFSPPFLILPSKQVDLLHFILQT